MGLTSPSPPPTAGQVLTLNSAAYQTWLWVDKGTGVGDSLIQIDWTPTTSVTSATTGISSTTTDAFAYRKGNQVWFTVNISLTWASLVSGIVPRLVINLSVPYATTTEQDIFCLSDLGRDGSAYGAIKNLGAPTGWVIQINTLLTAATKNLIISGVYVA